MEQFSHDLTLALEETSRTTSSKVRWGVRRRTRSTGNLPCAPQPTEDSSSSPTDPPACNVVMNQADSPYLSGSNNIVQSDSDDRHSVAFTFKLRQTPLSGNFESDSLNENFSPARPNMRRKRKYKRMAVEYETTPSTPHIVGNPLFPVAGTMKKRVFKHSGCPEGFRSTMFFCGKRKRSQRDRGGMDYDFCKQHSSSVPRQREFFGPKGSSYIEYKSRNRAASFSASMMKCERILPLNKTVVSKIERISADRDRERTALLEATRSSAIVTPSVPVPVPTGGEFNFSIPLQQQQQQVLLTGGIQQPTMPLDGGMILTLIGSQGHGADGLGIPHQIVTVGTNSVVPSVPLNQSNLGGIKPLIMPGERLNPVQQLVGPTVTMPVTDPAATGPTGQLNQVQTKPLLVHPFGSTVIKNPINIQQSFSETVATVPVPNTVQSIPEPMKAAVVTKAKGSYPKEKHRHRKSKYIRKKQMLMMAGPEGQGQLMDCGGQDFLSSSSLSSSDSEAVLANETDHEGDDELTDWPGNEAMITFASKHDFRKAYHGNRAPVAAGASSSALGRALLPHVDRQDEPDDDTLMSADELVTTEIIPGDACEITMQPAGVAIDGIGLGGIDPSLALPIGADLSGINTPFLVNNIAPGLPLANEIREIRAGCRRIREERPGFSIISSVNELLSRFLQDDQQRELTLHDVDKAEHDKLQDLCKLYSLNAQQLSENGSVVMLSKTSNTMQSVRIDQSNLPKRLGDFKRRCYGNAEALQFHDGATS
uniref:R3H domain-containing protein n=1 Tax=Anopheles christyi TaxID=43041 RepID=A0A182JTL9_9DIPT